MDYKVTEVAPITELTPAGKFIKKYRVRFSYKGIEDYVEVPEEDYSAEKVKALIEERVAEHKKLLG